MPKNKRNAFYYFMCAKQDEVSRRQGRKIPMKDLPGFLYEDWKNLSASKKRIYERMNDEEQSEKLDCRGVPYSIIKQMEDDKQKKYMSMQNEIIETVSILHGNGRALKEKCFFVISITHYVKTDEGEFVPAEVGISKFNFSDGIVANLHRILKANIPTGYKSDAKQHSELTHNLLEIDEKYHCDTRSLGSVIKDFIKEPGAGLQPVYAREELREQTEKIMDEIIGNGVVNVYSLDFFYATIYSAVHQRIPESIAESVLNSCTFDYNLDIPCEWHRTNAPDAGKYCASASSKRLIFIMCDNIDIYKSFGVKPVAGKHLPIKAPGGCEATDLLTDCISQRSYSQNQSWGGSGASALGWGARPDVDNAPCINSDQDFPSLMSRPSKAPAGVQPSNPLQKKPMTSGVGRGRKLAK